MALSFKRQQSLENNLELSPSSWHSRLISGHHPDPAWRKHLKHLSSNLGCEIQAATSVGTIRPSKGLYTKPKTSIFFFLLYLFIVSGCVGSSLLHAGFPLVAVSGSYSSLWCAGFSLRWLLLLRSRGSRLTGFSSCGTRAQ